MAAPARNQFWRKRAKSGRDKIFENPEQFRIEAYRYFQHCDDNPLYKNEAIKSGDNAGDIIQIPTMRPYTIQGLCRFIGITTQTFQNYEKDDSYKDFFAVFTHVREVIEENQISGAMVGAYNANLVARINSIADKQERKVIKQKGIKADVRSGGPDIRSDEKEIDLDKDTKYTQV